MAEILGIDVGGSGIKAALVDTVEGRFISERLRVDTPNPSTPENVATAIKQLVTDIGYDGIVGCCFPAAVVNGTAKTAGNIDDAWLDTAIDKTFSEVTGLPFVVLNDADAAAMTEMRFGAGKDLDGMVIMITIGTGLGSGVFYNGELIPNIEIGRMPGMDVERIELYASNRARKENELSWEEWGERFNYFLEKVTTVFTPDHIILGGGASKKFDHYEDAIKIPTHIHVAHTLNDAGIIGAAVAADSSGI